MRRPISIALNALLLCSALIITASASDLEGEVKQLRLAVERLAARIEAQETRISGLEKALGMGASGQSSRSTTTSPRILATDGWKNRDNWKRVKAGMSESQVREILGPPTSTSGAQWYYEGDVPGSGKVTGNIFWSSHRVLTIDEPVW